MKQQYDKEFKQNAVNYVRTHAELSVTKCAQNLGANDNTLLYRFKDGSEISLPVPGRK